MGIMIYLDNHSATKPCTSALERMRLYFEEQWGASFAPHKMGAELTLSLESRFQMLYDLIDAKEEDRSVFTSSGAEAINQVFWSIFTESCARASDGWRS
jgi:cysteine desulfurase